MTRALNSPHGCADLRQEARCEEISWKLAGFEPSAPISPRRVTKLSFTIQQPSGNPLTDYRKCCEPHAGVDLIIVRSDDSHVQYDDSDIAANGRITQGRPATFTTWRGALAHAIFFHC